MIENQLHLSFERPLKLYHFALFFRPPNTTVVGSPVPSISQQEWDCECQDFGVLSLPPTSCLPIILVFFQTFPPWVFLLSLQICSSLSHFKGRVWRKLFSHLLQKSCLPPSFYNKTCGKSWPNRLYLLAFTFLSFLLPVTTICVQQHSFHCTFYRGCSW